MANEPLSTDPHLASEVGEKPMPAMGMSGEEWDALPRERRLEMVDACLAFSRPMSDERVDLLREQSPNVLEGRTEPFYVRVIAGLLARVVASRDSGAESDSLTFESDEERGEWAEFVKYSERGADLDEVTKLADRFILALRERMPPQQYPRGRTSR
jgi:hypothetical protein